jgi:hypothetical protein
MTRPDEYCGGCCGEAAKRGRPVRKTDLYAYPLCGLCESRMREGLVRYRPSNGTEFRMFRSHCDNCRHCIDSEDDPKPGSLTPPFQCCSWGVLDRLYQQMWSKHDHISNWFNPLDLKPECPATCLRFTHRNDPEDESRNPPPPSDPAQMTFADLDIPVEAAPSFTTKSL